MGASMMRRLAILFQAYGFWCRPLLVAFIRSGPFSVRRPYFCFVFVFVLDIGVSSYENEIYKFAGARISSQVTVSQVMRGPHQTTSRRIE